VDRVIRHLNRVFDQNGLRSVSTPAQLIVAVLFLLAVAFCVVVVAWDTIDGTATSTESLVVLIAGVPFLVAAAIVLTVDAVVRGLRSSDRRR
jgi:hypothetical protein